jgi:hypothetical protein
MTQDDPARFGAPDYSFRNNKLALAHKTQT